MPASDTDAARFLAQATFGPTLPEIARLRQIGYKAWLDEQVVAAPSYQVDFLDTFTEDEIYDLQFGDQARLEAWFLHAMGEPDPRRAGIRHTDQLRQRMAFALSQVMVVSEVNSEPIVGRFGYAAAGYYDVLTRNALGNYRTLLEQVTLHPAMGSYLSMMGNQKPDAALNIRPDENYAREVMQLFSIGTEMLNLDGTPLRDAQGKPVPAYGQNTVKGFAHVFTGWRLGGCSAQEFDCYHWWPLKNPVLNQPMENFPAMYASAGEKQLLDYPGVRLSAGVLPANGEAKADLARALDNIFLHPNVGPFMAKRLIKRLVTSNPSPAYVARVAAVFNNNGAGVRGDLAATARAILMDPEARLVSQQPIGFGKVREPLLRLTHLWRAMDARTRSGRMAEYFLIEYHPERWLAQSPLKAPSVFNFYSPNYVPSGEMTTTGMTAPELQLATSEMLPITQNMIGDEIFGAYKGNPQAGPQDVLMDMQRDGALAADPGALLDRYNLLFFSGQMSQRLRGIVLARLNEIPNKNGGRDRIQEALFLLTNSPEYIVQK